jgi:hypothetical protein
MNDCGGDYGATIELYLDKELIGPDLEEFRAHLEACAACRVELEVREELVPPLASVTAVVLRSGCSSRSSEAYNGAVAFSRPLHTAPP